MKITTLVLALGAALMAAFLSSFSIRATGQNLLVTPVPTNTDAVELVTNGGFEIDTDGDLLPDGWLLQGNVTRQCFEEQCRIEFRGSPLASRLTQSIATGSAGRANDRLVLSVFSRGKNWVGKHFLILTIFYADGSKQQMFIDLNKHPEMLIRNEGQLTAAQDYVRLKLVFKMRSTTGWLRVDSVNLTRNVP